MRMVMATFSRWLGADYAFLKCLNAIESFDSP